MPRGPWFFAPDREDLLWSLEQLVKEYGFQVDVEQVVACAQSHASSAYEYIQEHFDGTVDAECISRDDAARVAVAAALQELGYDIDKDQVARDAALSAKWEHQRRYGEDVFPWEYE